jgi:hypothetical protein
VADPVPFSLATYMKDKAALWGRMVQKYGLKPTPYETLVSWPFGDFILHSDFDNISSTIKARVAGFHDCIDTEDMFTQLFQGTKEREDHSVEGRASDSWIPASVASALY